MNERRLAIAMRVTDVLSFVVPAMLGMLALYWYIQRAYWHALFDAGLLVFNIGWMRYLERRYERQRREFAIQLQMLQQAMRQEHLMQQPPPSDE